MLLTFEPNGPNLDGTFLSIQTTNTGSPQVIPLPASGVLLLAGLCALGSYRRRRAGDIQFA
jgi:hypothetical protein